MNMLAFQIGWSKVRLIRYCMLPKKHVPLFEGCESVMVLGLHQCPQYKCYVESESWSCMDPHKVSIERSDESTDELIFY